MNEDEARKLVAAEGKILLNTGLVARTWGNISARIDEDHFVITPSGLDYENMKPEDLVKMTISTKEYEGNRKPSSEKGIHIAAYALDPDTGYCIHTHQTYATAIGLCGIDKLDVTDEERKALGGMCVAAYGISSTKKLSKEVYKALKTGAKVIFMVHHGVLICGRDREEAFNRALLLEEICKRNLKGQPTDTPKYDARVEEVAKEVLKERRHAEIIVTPETLKAANIGKSIPAQVDDMAQMIGKKIPFIAPASKDEIVNALDKYGAALVAGLGIIVWDAKEDETIALSILAGKAVTVYLHSREAGVSGKLNGLDIFLQHLIYKKKYSKQKNA